MDKLLKATVTNVKRGINTRNGNARFHLHTVEYGKLTTKADADFVQYLKNERALPTGEELEVEVMFTLNGSNRITSYKLL